MKKNSNAVILKPGRDKAIRHHHHWIFSGAIDFAPPYTNGDVLGVTSAVGDHLGYGYFHHDTSIAGRMLSFDDTPGEPALQASLKRAIALRPHLIDTHTTTAYRLVNSEGDNIPGLVIDIYADTIVLQISTLGIEKLKPLIIETLQNELHPSGIYEKSNVPGRREEGLGNTEGILFGNIPEEIAITEHGLKFSVSLLHGQKTGLFLDQREMRQWVRELATGKRVLNCFGYTGGFSVYALSGGAKHVTTVDISEEAIALTKKNILLNGFENKNVRSIAADVFTLLHDEPLDFDLIILDPPAFAKKKTDVVAACRGYKEINRVALQKMPAGSLLLTSSCSYHVDEKLFQTVLFQAAVEAGRNVRIIGRHRLAPDHPMSIFHPEGEYLKSLLLFVE